MRPTLIRAAAQAAAQTAKKETGVLQKGARRDPELYVLLAVMSGAFGLAGFYFGRKPTSATSEAKVSIAHNSMPWQVEGADKDDTRDHFKYVSLPLAVWAALLRRSVSCTSITNLWPKSNITQRETQETPPKDAPSALHSVIVPNVNLPKELHDKYNKWGKDGY